MWDSSGTEDRYRKKVKKEYSTSELYRGHLPVYNFMETAEKKAVQMVEKGVEKI